MHVVGVVHRPDHVCCRYRLAPLRQPLASAGHRLELRSDPRRWVPRMRLWWQLRNADAVVLQRRIMSQWHVVMLRRYARRLIFDFDDAVFHRSSYSPKGNEDLIRRRRFAHTVQAADLIVAGNEFLRQEACRYAPADRVVVVPTCVDTSKYTLAEHHRSGSGIELAWIGSSSTVPGLERSRPLFDTVAQRLPDVRFRIICDRFPRFRCMPTIEVPWSEEKETRELARADIGISWVPDDRWSLGKCGLKVIQYMAAGLPVVANPVGIHKELVRHGETGFLARTPDEWVEAVRLLAADPLLRQRMGHAARRRVERDYSVTELARRWLNILHSFSPGLAA